MDKLKSILVCQHDNFSEKLKANEHFQQSKTAILKWSPRKRG